MDMACNCMNQSHISSQDDILQNSLVVEQPQKFENATPDTDVAFMEDLGAV